MYEKKRLLARGCVAGIIRRLGGENWAKNSYLPWSQNSEIFGCQSRVICGNK